MLCLPPRAKQCHRTKPLPTTQCSSTPAPAPSILTAYTPACSRGGVPSPDRVLGPYQDGKRWRVVQVVDGKRIARTATTQEKAVQIAQRLRHRPATPASPTLAAALREYEAHLRLERCLTPASCAHAQRTLRAFLLNEEMPIAALTEAHARQLARFEPAQARRIRRRYALSTRYAVLGHAARFFEWAKARQYVERNPFDGVRPIGLVSPAPAPLSLDHARTLALVALQQAHHDPAALGLLLILVSGLSSSQLLTLRAQDIGPDAQQLHVRGPRGVNPVLPIPELLRPYVHGVLAGKAPEDLLLGAGRTGRTRPHNFLWRAIQRLCSKARIPPTCPRHLRRLHRTLARTVAQASASRIPANPSRQASSPVSPRDTAPWMRIVDMLGLSPSMTVPRLDALISLLAPSQLAHLHRLLDSPLSRR